MMNRSGFTSRALSVMTMFSVSEPVTHAMPRARRAPSAIRTWSSVASPSIAMYPACIVPSTTRSSGSMATNGTLASASRSQTARPMRPRPQTMKWSDSFERALCILRLRVRLSSKMMGSSWPHEYVTMPMPPTRRIVVKRWPCSERP
jgi:hypothetical protein